MKMIARCSGVALAAIVGLAACASSPEVPDNSGDSPKNYQSTQSDDSSTESTSESTSKPSTMSSESVESGPTSRTSKQSGSKGSSGLPEATGPVAHVNGKEIPAEDFNDEVERVAQSDKFPPRLLNRLTERLVDRLIDKKLMEMKLDASDVEVTEDEIDAELDSVKAEIENLARAQGKKDATLETLTKQYGITEQELRDSLRQSIALEKYLVKNHDVTLPTDEDVKSFYENNAQKFTRPEQVHAHHILVRVEKGAGEKAWEKAKKKVAKVRQRIIAGEVTFAEAAQSTSEGPSAERGGDMGFISRDRLDKDFSKAAFSLETDTLSEPVKTQFGWHLIKITDRKSSKQVPFEEVRGRLRKKLEEREVKKGLEKMMADLRDQAKIEKHMDNIE